LVSALTLDHDGAALYKGAVASELKRLCSFAERHIGDEPGQRLTTIDHDIEHILSPNGAVGSLVASATSAKTRPVRLIVFDKSADNNWALGWHQDRTIAVRARRDVDGFGAWSVKDGIQHVAPPVAMLERMITVRVHLDDCGDDNAPLLIAPGSHKRGLVPASETASIAQSHSVQACLARAGDAWLYRTLILHASNRAATPTRRRVIQIDYADFDLPGGLEWLGLSVNAA
jgi:hypothetical protein